MKPIILDTTKYVLGDTPYKNVCRCLPGNLKRVRSRKLDDEVMVDVENMRIYMIETEFGRPNESIPGMNAYIDQEIRDRKYALKGKAMIEGHPLLDYDIYLIAAAEHEGTGPWYQFLGGAYLLDINRDDVEVAPGITFSYVVLPYFDREKYRREYDEHNHPGDTPLDKLQMMEKYVYQRTKIDLDLHTYDILAYQDECDIEPLLASVNWFHDGIPTIYGNDKEFLDEWEKLDERIRPHDYQKALARIQSNVPMWAVDIRMYVDKKYRLTTDSDLLRDYLVFAKDSFLHVSVIACFGKKYKGTMELEILHEANNYKNKMTLIDPTPKDLGSGEQLFTGTNGFHLDHVLGKGYKVPTDRKDEVTAVLYLDHKEILRKNFPVRPLVS